MSALIKKSGWDAWLRQVAAADDADAAVAEIDKARRHCENGIFAIGLALTAVKEKTPHGDFLVALKLSQWEERMAQRYMRVAAVFCGGVQNSDGKKNKGLPNPTLVSDLSPVTELGVKKLDYLAGELTAEEAAALARDGKVRGMSIDDLAERSVRQLRLDLRCGDDSSAAAEAREWKNLYQKKTRELREEQARRAAAEEAAKKETAMELSPVLHLIQDADLLVAHLKEAVAISDDIRRQVREVVEIDINAHDAAAMTEAANRIKKAINVANKHVGEARTALGDEAITRGIIAKKQEERE